MPGGPASCWRFVVGRTPAIIHLVRWQSNERLLAAWWWPLPRLAGITCCRCCCCCLPSDFSLPHEKQIRTSFVPELEEKQWIFRKNKTSIQLPQFTFTEQSGRASFCSAMRPLRRKTVVNLRFRCNGENYAGRMGNKSAQRTVFNNVAARERWSSCWSVLEMPSFHFCGGKGQMV